jgi:hypothetical protein
MVMLKRVHHFGNRFPDTRLRVSKNDPSPSVKPVKYQPNASSESKSIEWVSDMTASLKVVVFRAGGCRKYPSGPLILAEKIAKERAVA